MNSSPPESKIFYQGATRRKKFLLVFLRHFGCTFCKETMTELSRVKDQIKTRGFGIVLVHMVNASRAEQIFKLYDLSDVEHISDTRKELYSSFGLKRAGWKEIFSPIPLWRSVIAGLLKGHIAGKPLGDPYQMPGVFVCKNQEVLVKFNYNYISDKPDYLRLINMIK